MLKTALFEILSDFNRYLKNTNFVDTQKDAINREISTIAFIFGAMIFQATNGC